MTNTEKYLQPSGLFQDQNFEEFCSNIPKFSFNENVPDDVILNFEVIERLLAYSYFEYKFIDEAYAKAIHTFEMAMSIRLRDFFPENKKASFNTLIKELSNLNLFKTSNDTLQNIRNMRNHFSHPKRHGFGGIVYWKRIELLCNLINEMYEGVKTPEANNS